MFGPSVLRCTRSWHAATQLNTLERYIVTHRLSGLTLLKRVFNAASFLSFTEIHRNDKTRWWNADFSVTHQPLGEKHAIALSQRLPTWGKWVIYRSAYKRFAVCLLKSALLFSNRSRCWWSNVGLQTAVCGHPSRASLKSLRSSANHAACSRTLTLDWAKKLYVVRFSFMSIDPRLEFPSHLDLMPTEVDGPKGSRHPGLDSGVVFVASLEF